jgi:hypothetical protein
LTAYKLSAVSIRPDNTATQTLSLSYPHPTHPPPFVPQNKGLGPALVGSGISWGAYLYLYERVKAWHRGAQGEQRLTAGWNLLSAAQAGAMVGPIACVVAAASLRVVGLGRV